MLVSSGTAVAVGRRKKDEDFVITETNCYGVFDGHGGKEAAERCVAELPLRIVEGLQRKTMKKAFADACWAMDLALGESGVSSGTTATLLLLEENTASLGWIGDSSAIRFDMGSRRTVFTTSPHNPENPDEMNFLKRVWGLRNAASESSQMDLFDASASGVTEMYEDEFDAEKILDREQRISQSFRKSKIQLERQDSIVGRRQDHLGNAVGPLVVQTSWLDKGGRPITGASTTVTRSIGDWDAARSVLPEPDLVSWSLDDVLFDRIVIASDGLWELLTLAAVEAIVATNYDDPQRCADALLKRARASSLAKFRTPFKDDTSVVVVDIQSPSASISRPPPVDTRCTCSIS